MSKPSRKRKNTTIVLATTEATFWNGERTNARQVTVLVGHGGGFASPWYAGLEGTMRRAVKVIYGDRTFFLDDEDGSGWAKVTTGLGSPRFGHRELPDDSIVQGK